MEKPAYKHYSPVAILWRDAVKWVETTRLGGREIRNFAGWKPVGGRDAPYLDFWHRLLEWKDGQISNPCYIDLCYEDLSQFEDWEREILEAFHAEFGREATYYVNW
jgi:hypothetical protein